MRSPDELIHSRKERRDLTSRCQFEQTAEIFGGFHAHDVALQFLALIFADHIAAERGEFHRDFVFRHRIARIALGNIDTGGVRFAISRL